LSASDKSKFRIESGIRIINIRRSGGIAQMGLPNGFIVVKFNGKSYEAPEDLIAAMEGSSGKMQIQGLDPNGSSRSYSFYRY
jgi:S1-C subfamily serine protease